MDPMRCAPSGARVMLCLCVDDCVPAGELFCKVGTRSHVLGRFCLHPRKTPFCCSPPPLTKPETTSGVGRRVAASSQRGFMGSLRQRAPENTGRTEKDCQPPSLSDFLLTPALHFLSHSASLSPHGTSWGLCPSVEQDTSYPILISCRI